MTSRNSADSILRLLTEAASQTYEGPRGAYDFETNVLGRLLHILEYPKEYTLLDANYGTFQVDAAVATSRVEIPWLIAEAKLRFGRKDQDVVEQYRVASGARFAILISPKCLMIAQDGARQTYDFEKLHAGDAEQIEALLGARNAPDFSKSAAQVDHTTLLDAIAAAGTNDEKKKTLEDFARFLLTSSKVLTPKYGNVRTKSSEIDLICECVEGSWVREIYGRFALVECKNWAKPVGADSVRDFSSKLRDAEVRLGLLFSRKGITGEHKGTDARYEIQTLRSKSQVHVLVVSEEDWRELERLPFDAFLEKEIDRMTFNIEHIGTHFN